MVESLAYEKGHRISRQRDFDEVRRRGACARVSSVKLFALKKDRGASRLGLWVSKRHVRRAVDRNAVKRWVREFFRRKRRDFLFPCDIIFQVLRASDLANHERFDAALEKALKACQILR